jgi:hypothetical protein
VMSFQDVARLYRTRARTSVDTLGPSLRTEYELQNHHERVFSAISHKRRAVFNYSRVLYAHSAKNKTSLPVSVPTLHVSSVSPSSLLSNRGPFNGDRQLVGMVFANCRYIIARESAGKSVIPTRFPLSNLSGQGFIQYFSGDADYNLGFQSDGDCHHVLNLRRCQRSVRWKDAPVSLIVVSPRIEVTTISLSPDTRSIRTAEALSMGPAASSFNFQ